MRIAVYPADEGGCGCYRLIWPTEALIADGRDITLIRPGDDGAHIDGLFVDDPEPRLVDVRAPDADVVVLQRPLTRALVDVIPHLQAKGIRVVVEIDDDFGALHPRNVSFRAVHPAHNPNRNWQHLARACRAADLVTVTTPALAKRYGAHGRVKILPNCVPARYLDETRGEHPGLYVGWTGSLATHPGDLEVTRGAIGRAMEWSDSRFAVVGTGVGVQRALNLHHAPLAPGWVDIADYPTAMAQLDVGIVPLAGIEFNQAKSGLKMLEFAALGVPVLATPTADNIRLHDQGIGVLCSKPKEWERHLRALLASSVARDDLAAKGREAAAEWTIEAHAWRWWETWTTVQAKEQAA